MNYLPFHEAIRMVFKGKAVRRVAWPETMHVLFIQNEVVNSTRIIMNTGSEYILYQPTPEDMVANDWFIM